MSPELKNIRQEINGVVGGAFENPPSPPPSPLELCVAHRTSGSCCFSSVEPGLSTLLEVTRALVTFLAVLSKYLIKSERIRVYFGAQFRETQSQGGLLCHTRSDIAIQHRGLKATSTQLKPLKQDPLSHPLISSPVATRFP